MDESEGDDTIPIPAAPVADVLTGPLRAELSFPPSPSPILFYQARHREVGEGWTVTDNLPAYTSGITVGPLDAATNYEFGLRLVAEKGAKAIGVQARLSQRRSTKGCQMSHNPIYPGFVWKQAFDFPPGFFEPGDTACAEFRRFAQDPLPLAGVQSGGGIELDGDRLFVELSEDQIAAIGKRGGSTVTNFVVEREGENFPIGVIVTIPVVLLPTRSE